MEIKNDEGVVEESLDLPEVKEGEADTTDWRAEAQKLREKAIKQRERTKALKEQLKAKDEADKPIAKQEVTSVDLGEKAYLAVNGIKTPDEVAFFSKMKKETGKDAESLLGSTYFQVEFKDFKEKRDSSNATPTASKRSNNSSVDTVEFWLAKDELPPISEAELRTKVVNALMKREQSKGSFHNSK
jgi:hypothetical protein